MAYSEVREHNPKVEFGVDDPNNNGVGRRKSPCWRHVGHPSEQLLK